MNEGNKLKQEWMDENSLDEKCFSVRNLLPLLSVSPYRWYLWGFKTNI